jgi:hypothetical protein
MKRLKEKKHSSLLRTLVTYERKKFCNTGPTVDQKGFAQSSSISCLSMFVEKKVSYSALFKNLVGWHAGAVSFPLSDVILAQLACPLSDVMFCLHSGITNLSLYKHCCLRVHYRLGHRFLRYPLL